MLTVLLALGLAALIPFLDYWRHRYANISHRALLGRLARLEACIAVVWTSMGTNERPLHLRTFDDFVPGPLAKPSLDDVISLLEPFAQSDLRDAGR